MTSEAHVFAIEDTTVQVCWAALPGSPAVVRAGSRSVEVDADPARPGAVVVDGLAPGALVEVTIESRGRVVPAGRVQTLRPPPGRELARIAVITDLHLGEPGFGIFPRYHDPRHGRDRYPFRCSAAAVAEALAWGAEVVVVKGDLTWSGRVNQWELAAELFDGVPVPVVAVMGNHDTVPKAVDARPYLERVGVVVVGAEPVVHDVAGLRIVAVPTADNGHSPGRMPADRRERVLALACERETPALLAQHHYPDRLPVPTRYPAGIPKREGDAYLAALADQKPASLVTCGHTHRHHRRTAGPVPVVETGSTKDYPGVWAGYVVHEHGIRQVVRRVADPDAIAWTERTGQTLFRLWRHWSPGRLADRCFSHTWPAPPGV